MKNQDYLYHGPQYQRQKHYDGAARNGMDVARFNFSHGDYNEHQGRLELLKEVRKELDIPVAALLDTKGTGDPYRTA